MECSSQSVLLRLIYFLLVNIYNKIFLSIYCFSEMIVCVFYTLFLQFLLLGELR